LESYPQEVAILSLENKGDIMKFLEGHFVKDFAAFAVAVVLVAGGFNYVNAAPDEDIRIVKVNDSNFESEVLKSKKPVILDVTSTSCPPCLIMIPTLIGIAKNYPDIKVATVGIDEPGIDNIKATLPIQAFPTFFLIKNGQILDRLVGVVKEEQLLSALQYTPKKTAAKPAKKSKNSPKNLVCKVNGQFNGIKNLVTISFVFGENEIENVDIVTDGFIPPEMEPQREQILARMQASGKGEVTPTMTGFRMHIDNDCRFMKAMDMKRTSTYGEMRAGLELQGFTCK
jgi:Thioredoxin domain-containing protein